MTSHDQIEYATLTDVGVRRSHNQDAHTALVASDADRWRQHGHVFLVADGLGAQAVGELASAIAVGVVPHLYQKYAQEDGVVEALKKAFAEANATIYERGQKNPEFSGMGTTCTALILRPDGAWVGHVGDSRAYRIRDGTIQQLSFDHSLVWEKARRQKVKPEELPNIPRNVIVRSLGPQAEVEIDIQGPHPVKEGDVYLLCSDGLTGPLADPEIGAVATALPPAEACQFLIDLTNLRGGPDNITVLIIRATTSTNQDPSAFANRVPIYKLVPWPLGALLLGFLLAAGTAALAYNNVWGAMYVFALAMLAIGTGIGGLFRWWVKEKNRLANAPPEYRPKLKIYRQAPCKADRDFLDKLAKIETALAKKAKEHSWDVSWSINQEHQQQAKKFLDQGDLASAFREQCRALRPLTKALHRYRHKLEAFHPTWEKTDK